MPLRSELTVSTLVVLALNPVVTESVPPPKITSFPADPRLASAATCRIPAFTNTLPVKVFAPERISVPASALDMETTPSPASP